jgi:hypothetical protein
MLSTRIQAESLLDGLRPNPNGTQPHGEINEVSYL